MIGRVAELQQVKIRENRHSGELIEDVVKMWVSGGSGAVLLEFA